ncbi:MAG: DUF924 domain-containing protein [Planctomycetes bacterium]|nr:DUF924 domain-containing protein [Planctomycetota bacterium]
MAKALLHCVRRPAHWPTRWPPCWRSCAPAKPPEPRRPAFRRRTASTPASRRRRRLRQSRRARSGQGGRKRQRPAWPVLGCDRAPKRSAEDDDSGRGEVLAPDGQQLRDLLQLLTQLRDLAPGLVQLFLLRLLLVAHRTAVDVHDLAVEVRVADLGTGVAPPGVVQLAQHVVARRHDHGTRAALAAGHDRALPSDAHRLFLYLPLEHSEELADQEDACRLTAALSEGRWYDFAVLHRDIIARFGRFPHRNAILGRESSAEELEFLGGPNSSF